MKRYFSFMLPGLILCLLMTLNTVPAQEVNLGIVSYSMVGGDYHSIERQGDYAFVSTFYGFKILDVSDPEQPIEVVHVPTDGIAYHAIASENLVFVSDVGCGLTCYDITDITNPVMTDRIDLEGHIRSSYPLEEESLVYVAMEDDGLQLVDYSDPSNLQLIDVLYTGGWVFQPKVYDQWLYLTLGTAGMGVYDISEPTSPQQTLIWNTGGGKARELFIWPDGNHLAIADDWNGVYILDLEFPWIPTWSATVEPDPTAITLSVSGEDNYGAAAYYNKKIATFDFDGDVLDEQEVRFCLSVCMIDDYAYVSCADSALVIYDCDSPTNIQYETMIENIRPLGALARLDNLIYICNGREGIAIVDVSDPVYPEQLETIEIEGWTNSLLISPDHEYLYVCDYFSGINVYGIEDPLHPVYLTTVSTDPDTGCSGLTYHDGYLYAAMYEIGPNVFDLSDPANPVLTWAAPDSVEEFTGMAPFPDGEHMMGVAGVNGLLVYDITGPGELEYEYTYEDIAYVSNVAVVGDYAYVTDPNVQKKVYALDVSNYAYIFKVDSLEGIAGFTGTRDLGDDMLMALDHTAGIAIIDISDPYNLTEIDRHETPGYPLGGACDGEYIYFNDTYSLIIFDMYAPGVQGPYEIPGIPKDMALLHPAFPNPFNPTTTLTFDIQKPGRAKISVFNVAGEQVCTLYDAYAKPGRYTTTFNGENLASGIYFAKLQVHQLEQTQKLLYVK